VERVEELETLIGEVPLGAWESDIRRGMSDDGLCSEVEKWRRARDRDPVFGPPRTRR
jgi:hypothetical protein